MTDYLIIRQRTISFPGYEGKTLTVIHLCYMTVLRKATCSYRDCVELHSESEAGLMTLLEELWFWVKLKDEELIRKTTTGNDVNYLLQQQDYYMVSYKSILKRLDS